MSKRHGARSIRQLREEGIRPERIVGWLAHSCGLLEEIREVEAAQLVGLFDIGRVHNNDSVVVLPEWLLGR